MSESADQASWPAIIHVLVDVPNPAGGLMKAEVRITAEHAVRIGDDGIKQVWTALADAIPVPADWKR